MTLHDEQAPIQEVSYIYFWHEPEWNAWKVGKGDPHTRMSDYAEKNNLQYSADSLRCFAVSSSALAYRIEQLLHVALVENYAFRRFPGKGKGLELFLAPEGIDVPETLTEVITRTIASIDNENASVSQRHTPGLPDADVVLPPQTTPLFFYDFLRNEGFTRQQILRRDLPSDVLDVLEERYSRRYEPQFIAERDDGRQADKAHQAELGSLSDSVEQQKLALQAASAVPPYNTEPEPLVPPEKEGSFFSGAVWFGVVISGCLMLYRGYLAPAPTSPITAAVKAPETIVTPPTTPMKSVAPAVPIGAPLASLAVPANSAPALPKRSDVNLICYPSSPSQIVQANVSVKDGKFKVVFVGSSGQRYDRSTQYEMSSIATRWDGVSVRNTNTRMVGELYKSGSQTRYRETVFKNGSEISSSDMRCE
jgi:hypothetical protein